MSRLKPLSSSGAASHALDRAESSSLELVVGDLLEEVVDALIVPLGPQGGAESRVQLSIRRAAGAGYEPELAQRIRGAPGGEVRPGRCVVTGGHGLSVRHIVHCRLAEAPAAEPAIEALLTLALDQAFRTCRILGVSSVALPAMGTGAYGYKTSAVARIAVGRALRAQRDAGGPERIRFVLASSSTLATFLHAANDAQAELGAPS